MAKIKEWLADIEELVVEAIELGAKTENDVFSYVYQYDDRVSEETVNEILRVFFGDSLDISYGALYPTYH